jgi:membrane protease YdiL (CAAX protease family)
VAFAIGIVGATLLQVLVQGAGAADRSISVTADGLIGEWIGLLGVPLWLSRTRGSASLARDFGLRLQGWHDVWLGLAVGLGTYFVLLVVVYPPIIRLLQHVEGRHIDIGKSAKDLSHQGRGVGFVVFAVCVTVGAPIAEEVFFRGLVLGALRRRLRDALAIVLTGIVFGLVHAGGDAKEALPALAVFGGVLAYLAVRTGRLGPGIVAHAAFNGVTVVSLILNR